MKAAGPVHHVSEELLVEYCAGACTEAAALAVACHLSLCAACADRRRALEALGGASLEAAAPQALAADALARTLARLDGAAGTDAEAAADPAIEALLTSWSVPRTLAPYVPAGTSASSWRRLVPGIKRIDLQRLGPRSTVARLVTLAPDLEIPFHDHGGTEYIVIFSGALVDEEGRFARGDLSVREAGARHVQRIDAAAPCVALVINEGPLVPLTWKGKALQLLSGG